MHFGPFRACKRAISGLLKRVGLVLARGPRRRPKHGPMQRAGPTRPEIITCRAVLFFRASCPPIRPGPNVHIYVEGTFTLWMHVCIHLSCAMQCVGPRREIIVVTCKRAMTVIFP